MQEDLNFFSLPSNEALPGAALLRHDCANENVSIFSFCVHQSTDGRKKMRPFPEGDAFLSERMESCGKKNTLLLMTCYPTMFSAMESIAAQIVYRFLPSFDFFSERGAKDAANGSNRKTVDHSDHNEHKDKENPKDSASLFYTPCPFFFTHSLVCGDCCSRGGSWLSYAASCRSKTH